MSMARASSSAWALALAMGLISIMPEVGEQQRTVCYILAGIFLSFGAVGLWIAWRTPADRTVTLANPQGDASDDHASNRRPRLFGALSFAGGALIAKWQIYDSLHSAERGAREVWVSDKLIGVSILAIIYGAALMVFGNKPNKWLKIDPANVGWKSAAFLVGIAAIGLAAYIWVMSELSSQGYSR